ncbi:hypothetical protein [Lactiplantibacillus daowaiensis]|uniref:Integral membrane protein n=1 Tax=Lactiplantibacillus daowaiensis TaxID=2559918 RepID=A0ABW1S289_9LACO|nr:hypothetical protein [Lactiplantibacillus daowaiensis]
MSILKAAMQAASHWIGYCLVAALFKIPIDLILKRPVLNGLWHGFVVASWLVRGQMLGLLLVILLGGWLVFTVVSALGKLISAWLKRQDSNV